MTWTPPGPEEDEQALPSMPPRRRGRPRADETHPERIKHIRAAFLVLAAGYHVNQVAKGYKVGAKTIYRWIDMVKGYTDPEAHALREICGIEAQSSETEGGRHRRGRPRAVATPAILECVEAMDCGEVPVATLAARYGVSRSTLYRWRQQFGE